MIQVVRDGAGGAPSRLSTSRRVFQMFESFRASHPLQTETSRSPPSAARPASSGMRHTKRGWNSGCDLIEVV
jgi:hypothetical protein